MRHRSTLLSRHKPLLMFGIGDFKFRAALIAAFSSGALHKIDEGRRVSFDARDLPREVLLLLHHADNVKEQRHTRARYL